MDFLSIIIFLFVILEISNIIILYFKPDSKLGNGVAVFNAWEESKKTPKLHEFIKYLVYWVAGSKLIFVTLLLVILAIGTPTVKILSLIVLILSISSFYWKLYPIIKGLDNEGHITPKGYSKSLGIMITGFILIFSLALLIYFII